MSQLDELDWMKDFADSLTAMSPPAITRGEDRA
jgi:hypothetical protein